MFLKIIEFHWQILAGPILAIVGLALLLAAGSIFFYIRQGRKIAGTKERVAEILRLKHMGVFGILMIGVGLAAFAFLGRGQTLTAKYGFIAPRDGEIAKIYYQPLTENRAIPVKELIRTSYRTVKDELLMTYNGHIETPFIVFGEGAFALEFRASGTEVEEEWSRIVVGVLEINGEGTHLVGNPFVYELTSESKVFRIPMQAAPGKIEAVRVQFINPNNKMKEPVRVVTISHVVFKRESK